jgi:hypothetical protein
MTRVPLVQLAHARSGDKGDSANIGVVAYAPELYPILVDQLTADRVRAHFATWVHGDVTRYELPNLWALNFVMRRALDGGGTVSLRTDAQGKVLSAALLRIELDVPDEVAERTRGQGRVPPGWSPPRAVSVAP